jgi:hypothetical protein
MERDAVVAVVLFLFFLFQGEPLLLLLRKVARLGAPTSENSCEKANDDDDRGCDNNGVVIGVVVEKAWTLCSLPNPANSESNNNTDIETIFASPPE